MKLKPGITIISLDPMLTVKQVKVLCGLSAPTIWRLRREGQFPKAVPLHGRRIGWPKSVIEGWIKNRGNV